MLCGARPGGAVALAYTFLREMRCFGCSLADWLAGWLSGWLAGCLPGWLVGPGRGEDGMGEGRGEERKGEARRGEGRREGGETLYKKVREFPKLPIARKPLHYYAYIYHI